MTHFPLTRRTLIASVAALPLEPLAQPAGAAAPMLGPATPTFNRFTLGEFEVTTLLSNSFSRPGPQSIFGLNVSKEDFAQASDAAYLPTDQARFFFTPTVVNTGTELVLFDTGQSDTDITTALAATGYVTEQVDIVVITHMHGDYIGGLMSGGTPTFANTRYVTGAVEFDAWVNAGNDKFDSNMKPLAEKSTFLKPGDSPAPGITAVHAFGHTPGHMAYMIESKGKQLLIAADFANHYVWSLAHPDWEVKFDIDKAAAAATARSCLTCSPPTKSPLSATTYPGRPSDMSNPVARATATCPKAIS